MLHDLYKKIHSLNSLEPSPEVNEAFGSIVKEAIVGKAKVKLSEEQIHQLQQTCSRAEYFLERYWARTIMAAEDPVACLRQFPYWQNYLDLTKMELHGLLGCSELEDLKIVFVGGGPLPCTAFVLSMVYGYTVTIIEKEQEAVELSRKLIERLGLQDQIKVITADATEYTDYAEYNVFFVAALAGMHKKDKRQIIANIVKRGSSAAYILARSSWGRRKLLYAPLDRTLYTLTKPLLEIHPHNEIVNSVVIFQT